MNSLTPSSWRLLVTPPARGAWNMALDEAILEACGRGDAPATLRLYAWEPACLSLGYAQPVEDVDLGRLQARGWDLVRRPTGGRAVLHTDEITYSVIASPGEARTSGTVLEAYNRIAAALVETLRLLDLPVEIQERPQAGNNNSNPVCFEVPSTYEITVGGKKLVGSAQARRKDGVLQHGSLPLTGDLTRILQVLVFPEESARLAAAGRLLEKATTVETVLGRVIAWETAAEAFMSAFRSRLNLDLLPSPATQAELDRAEALVRQKYAHPDWTQRPKIKS
jgi:lipoate-protein ligase A